MKYMCDRFGVFLFFFLSFFLAIGSSPLLAREKGAVEEQQKLFQRNHIPRSYSFEYLMGLTEEGKNQARHGIRESDRDLLTRLKKSYDAAVPFIFPITSSELKERVRDARAASHGIPKVLHFIWLGPDPFPAESVQNVRAWYTQHPGWTINFWTDSADRPLPIPAMTRRLANTYVFGKTHELIERTDNWGEKSDLMRYAILAHEGGIYVDHDMPCKRSFRPFVDHFDFFASLEYLHYHESIDSFVHPCNGLIGARPGHPIFKATMGYISEIWEAVETLHPLEEESDQRVLKRTYDSFAAAMLLLWRFDAKRRDVILPSSYFYAFKVFQNPERQALARAGIVYANHIYAGTWKQ